MDQTILIQRAHRKYIEDYANDTCKRSGRPIALCEFLFVVEIFDLNSAFFVVGNFRLEWCFWFLKF
jgi:hypothetical protein